MSSTATLIQSASAASYGLVLSMTVYLALFAGLVLFFRPLLVGIGRALYLTVCPRPRKTLASASGSAAGGSEAGHKLAHSDAPKAADLSSMSTRR